MKKYVLIIAALCLFLSASAQQAGPSKAAAVQQVIKNLFKGMLEADSALAASAFAPDCILQTIRQDASGASVRTDELRPFLGFIGKATKGAFDERISFRKVEFDGPLAVVWTDYVFYNKGTMSHCGVNSFTLVNTANGWKIVHLIDTRRKSGCKEITGTN